MVTSSFRSLPWLACSLGTVMLLACGDDSTGGSGGGATTGSSSGATTSSGGDATTGSGGEATTGSGGDATTGSGGDATTGSGGSTSSDDPYPAERGFEFDGSWYPELPTIAPCGNNGNISTYQVGAREGSGEQAITAWLFATGDGVIPAPGNYSVSAYDGATGPMEADFVLTDLRDSAQYLSDAVSGTLTVYDAGEGVIDVVWQNVSLSTVLGVTNTSAEGWVTCTY